MASRCRFAVPTLLALAFLGLFVPASAQADSPPVEATGAAVVDYPKDADWWYGTGSKDPVEFYYSKPLEGLVGYPYETPEYKDYPDKWHYPTYKNPGIYKKYKVYKVRKVYKPPKGWYIKYASFLGYNYYNNKAYIEFIEHNGKFKKFYFAYVELPYGAYFKSFAIKYTKKQLTVKYQYYGLK